MKLELSYEPAILFLGVIVRDTIAMLRHHD